MCKTSDGTDIAAASIVEQSQRGWPAVIAGGFLIGFRHHPG
jgi:hypothetical protein